jgi:hypothetical protein
VQAVRKPSFKKTTAARKEATHSASETESDEVRLNMTLLYAIGIP